jgi:hypothetical protein
MSLCAVNDDNVGGYMAAVVLLQLVQPGLLALAILTGVRCKYEIIPVTNREGYKQSYFALIGYGIITVATVVPCNIIWIADVVEDTVEYCMRVNQTALAFSTAPSVTVVCEWIDCECHANSTALLCLPFLENRTSVAECQLPGGCCFNETLYGTCDFYGTRDCALECLPEYTATAVKRTSLSGDFNYTAHKRGNVSYASFLEVYPRIPVPCLVYTSERDSSINTFAAPSPINIFAPGFRKDDHREIYGFSIVMLVYLVLYGTSIFAWLLSVAIVYCRGCCFLLITQKARRVEMAHVSKDYIVSVS